MLSFVKYFLNFIVDTIQFCITCVTEGSDSSLCQDSGVTVTYRGDSGAPLFSFRKKTAIKLTALCDVDFKW